MSARLATFMTFHIALLGAITGCRTRPEPLSLPPLAPTVTYRHVDHANPDAAPQKCAARWFAVRATPTGEAISQAASAIVRDRLEPFRGRSRMPIGSRWLHGEDLARWRDSDDRGDPLQEQLLAATELVVVPGLAAIVPAPDAALPQLELYFAREAAREVHVVLDVPADREAGREVLVIDPGWTTEQPGALFVPTEALRPGGLLVVFTPTGAAAPATVASARAVADARVAPPTEAKSPRALAWQVARQAVGARNRRPALLALVTPLQLARAVDMLVVADERALIAVTPEMTATDPDSDDVAWQLERALWRALMPRLERHELTPAMQAAAVRHLGALADDPATLSLLLQTCGDDAAFRQALTSENVLALDDRSAAARLTAQTFLAARGVVVAGYEPMAARAERRLALRRYRDAAEAGR